jgi:ribonucleoside-diphosphate reductase alpha chain
VLCEKFAHTRFEPSGWSKTPEIGFAKSIMDYIFRWLHLRFLTGQQQSLFEGLRPITPSMLPENGSSAPPENGSSASNSSAPFSALNLKLETGSASSSAGSVSVHASDRLKDFVDLGDAPSCQFCGAIMIRNGSCYRCMSCGSTSGCS